MRIAIVGAGIAGVHAASLLKDHATVELFEAAERGAASRPLQMEGSLFYLDNDPGLPPAYSFNKIILRSKTVETVLEGKIGSAFKLGGKEGIDARMRREIEEEIPIHYDTRIRQLEELKGYDIIIGADGYRSVIARQAGMREPHPYQWGFGIGMTIEGSFEIGVTDGVFNCELAPGGYIYLIPMSEDLATLASACYAQRLPVTTYRDKLRIYAKSRGFKIVEEWMDFEAWYQFRSYQHNNIYIIGGAASFTDQSFGFGIKYALSSAELCARAIIEKKDYQQLLRPLQKELGYWRKLSPYFVNATTTVQDRYIRLKGRFPMRQLIERGRSIKTFAPIIRMLSR